MTDQKKTAFQLILLFGPVSFLMTWFTGGIALTAFTFRGFKIDNE